MSQTEINGDKNIIFVTDQAIGDQASGLWAQWAG